MTSPKPTELANIDVVMANLEAWSQSAYDGLTRISLTLDQTLGAEVTTSLAVLLGVVSLVLALLPIWLAWRKPAIVPAQPEQSVTKPELSPATTADNSEGKPEDKPDQMHPERLQELYGRPPIRETQVANDALQEEPAPIAPAPDVRNDVQLGLMADLSEELAQQQRLLQKLTLQSAKQQQQIDTLLTQLNAQSSAFLLQGERLLRLEGLVEHAAESVPDATSNEERQRLSTFDQAIELAVQGATAETLMTQCGLSVSEAKLVVLVHGNVAAG